MNLTFSGALFAVPPTFTPTVTATWTSTPTFSSTPTPSSTQTPAVGEGSWTFVANKALPFITGDQGLSALFTYKAGLTAWPATGGLLTLFFAPGLGTPTAANFYVVPSYASKVIPTPVFNGLTVSIQVKNLAPGDSLPFYYGYDPIGFAVNTTTSPIAFGVAAYVDTYSAGTGAVVSPNPGQAVLAVVTPTFTSTISVTGTISPTISQTPTASSTCTVTPTFTQSPIGPEPSGTVYTYPNPFDLKKFDKCTFRFPSTTNASITVFNLVGEPVRQIPDTDINALQGWAVWPGVDDYLRKVTGGLYYVRVRSNTGTVVKKFTVLF